MRNIFQSLKKRKVIFAVGVAVCTFKNPAVDGKGRDYFIMVSKSDQEKIKSLGFKEADESRLRILERDLNGEEVMFFDQIKKDFVMVQYNRDGRVYEMKDQGFKEYYKKQMNGNTGQNI